MLSDKHLTNLVNVVVGILLNDEDEVLVQKRQLSKRFGGKIEFPAGKVETGENIVDGLYREIYEEIGVDIQDASYIDMISFMDDDNIICMHFFIITEWEGEPRGKEGQSVMWCNPIYAMEELDFLEKEKLIYEEMMNFIYHDDDDHHGLLLH